MSSYNTPAQTAKAAVESGVAKANLPVSSMLVGGFLAGAYIAFGGLLAIVGTAGVDKIFGGFVTIVTGLVFSLGLILTVIGGAELLTGNMALLPLAAFDKRITWAKVAVNWFWVTIGNLVGSLFVAYVLAYRTGVIGTITAKAGTGPAANYARAAAIATGKAITESHFEVFLRAIGCNWLVCLAVWLAIASHDVIGKIFGIVFPITAFVAMGFDHVVANMFFLPLGMFLGVPNLSVSAVSWNLAMAYCGNIVGAAVFVAFAYWFAYLRVRPSGPVPVHPGASETLDERELRD